MNEEFNRFYILLDEATDRSNYNLEIGFCGGRKNWKPGEKPLKNRKETLKYQCLNTLKHVSFFVRFVMVNSNLELDFFILRQVLLTECFQVVRSKCCFDIYSPHKSSMMK